MGRCVAVTGTATSVSSGMTPARRQAAACSWRQEEKEGGRVRACQTWRADAGAVTVRNGGSVSVSRHYFPLRFWISAGQAATAVVPLRESGSGRARAAFAQGARVIGSLTAVTDSLTVPNHWLSPSQTHSSTDCCALNPVAT